MILVYQDIITGLQIEEIAQLKTRMQELDEWVHRWAQRYRHLVADKTTSWSSETDKVVRLQHRLYAERKKSLSDRLSGC